MFVPLVGVVEVLLFVVDVPKLNEGRLCESAGLELLPKVEPNENPPDGLSF